MIGIIDYNMGNLQSVLNAFGKLGTKAELVKAPEAVARYEKIILPGVGAFKDAITHLTRNAMDEAIVSFAKGGKPLLGICLGMQLLFESSEEFGFTSGLGLVPGKIVKFDPARFETPLKVPHMGWNRLHVTQHSPLFAGMDEAMYLYFVHSFHAVCDARFAVGMTHYGYDFVSAVQRDNVFGFQPHPEKSHNNGLAILQNFIDL
jgi:glutamine amidotransferase